ERQIPQIVDPTKRELTGKTVCLTGQLQAIIGDERVSKQTAILLATNRGMVVKRNVTKKLDFLVAADPDSQSSKARQARKYGVRILAESVFWRMLGVDVND
ncbi:MAG: BRCT domain-containing protein, partial [Deltaproteobacteria bacterium]|nr:BRCT domain-containing protein [Deltaproteobacteria bacterium]